MKTEMNSPSEVTPEDYISYIQETKLMFFAPDRVFDFSTAVCKI